MAYNTDTNIAQFLQFEDKSGIIFHVREYEYVKYHKHPTLQILIGLNGDVGLAGEKGEYNYGRAFAIAPHYIHKYIGKHTLSLCVFIDSEHEVARKLIASLNLFEKGICELKIDKEEVCISRIVDKIINQQNILIDFLNILGITLQNSVILPSPVLKCIKYIKGNLGEKITIAELTDITHLSESRLQHVFKESMGLPIRRYIVWKKMQMAIEAIAAGSSFTEAAYNGGFSDSSTF